MNKRKRRNNCRSLALRASKNVFAVCANNEDKYSQKLIYANF